MRKWEFTIDLFISWAGVLFLLLTWQLVWTFQLVNQSVFPGPFEVFRAVLTGVSLPRLIEHITISLSRVISGFLLGAIFGMTIGIASGWYRWLGDMIRAPIEIIRPIPPLAWIPLALIWFGLGEPSKIFVIFLGAFFPIFTNSYKGMENINPQLIRAAQTLGVRGWRLLVLIALPAAMPDIATGIRVGWSLSFGSLVASEILAATSGLGYMIMHARELGEISIIIFGIFLIGLLNLISDSLINEYILKKQLKWYFGGIHMA